MLRVRLTAIGFLVVFVVVMLFIPVVLTYTFLAGDRATARVTHCDVRPKKTDCSGRWTDSGGTSGSGHISEVGPDDVGHSVAVRIGPLGPYAGSLGDEWPLFLTALPVFIAPPILARRFRRIYVLARARTERLASEAPSGATLLSVSPTKAVGTDGITYAEVRDSDAPAGHLPVELPGRRPRGNPRSAFRSVAGMSSDTTGFATVYGPAGEPRFVLERRGFRAYEPETWLLDPVGTPQAVIRRVAWFPSAYELLRADGNPLGAIRTPQDARSGAFEAWDEGGRPLAVMAAGGREWMLRVEPGTPGPLADLLLGFLFDVRRLSL